MKGRFSVVALIALVLGAADRSTLAVGSTAQSTDARYGKFIWNDLVTTDLTACRQFYGSLLGWSFQQKTRDGRTYLVAEIGGTPVAGLLDVRDLKDANSQWVSFMSVPDVDAAAEQVRAAGGRILVQPRPIKVGGRAAVVVDPQGAPLGLARLTGGDPADVTDFPSGRFFWTEYLARDGNQALDFYKRLAGYEATTTETSQGMQYFVLRRDRPRAGLFQIPADVGGVRPNWLPYVRVDDPSALAQKAQALGGRVVLEPSQERRHGTLAIVADPSGAALALQKWPIS
jgi:uncharacterized protein